MTGSGMTAASGRVAVLGAGGWGTAMAAHLVGRVVAGEGGPVRSVILCCHMEEHARSLREQRENRLYLPGVPLPDRLEVTAEPARALDGADLAAVAIPCQFLRGSLESMASVFPADLPAVSLVKGLERGTGRRPTEVLRESLGQRPVAVLSGPSHAEDLARGLPTSVVAASVEPALAGRVQAVFAGGVLRVYRGDDALGVELGGILKNVMALAAGMTDGLGLGDNAKAALVCRGLAEMARLGVALGARAETFAGLAGLGDLIVTCYSQHGRNRAVGERLGRGETPAQVQASMRQVAEGVATAPVVQNLAGSMGVDAPVTRAVCAVLDGSRTPAQAAADLLQREAGEEDPLG